MYSSSGSGTTSNKSWVLHSLIVGAVIAGAYAVFSLRRPERFRSRVVGIIPARYESSRFSGKPLVQILGKPMIQRTWERAKSATSTNSECWIAIQETLGLNNGAQFFALSFLNTKTKQDTFLKMSPDQRLDWITWAQREHKANKL